MALDYSKLTTAELEAIANDDFTKLSNRTLRALSNEPEPTAIDKFKEPFKDVSVKDWAEKSFLAPMLQTMQSVTPFGMLRPDLARQNLQQGSQNLAGKVGQMAQGAYNVATNPVESAQKAYNAVTENPAGVAGEFAKGLLYDPEMLIGSGLGNVAEKGLMSAGRGVKNVAGGATDIVGGAVGRGTGYIAKPGEVPTGYQVPSSRAPLRNTVMLPEDMARFERGEMPYGQMPTEVPIQQLPRNAVERTALKLSGGEIPYQGQAARAFGERLGETYRNPFTAALDIGSIFATGGIPVLTAARSGLAGVQGIADSILARRGLDPNLPTRLADYQSGARPMPGTPPPRAPSPGPVNPATMNYPLTVQGPGQQLPPSVMTAPDLSRRVNIEGQSSVLPSQINTTNSQTARPQPLQPVTPQQLAIEKTQQIVNQQAPVQQAPVQQAPVQQAPVATTPVVRTAPAPLEDILAKTRQVTREESKALGKQNRANEKAKAEGKTVTKEPVHPEVERIAKEAEPLTQDYIKSLDLGNKTLAEKDAIKQSLITEETKLKYSIRDNKITKALNNDEIEALMKRYHAVAKARDVIQNEQVTLSQTKTTLKNWQDIFDRAAAKGKPANLGGPINKPQILTQDMLDDLRNTINHIERNETTVPQPTTIENKVDVIRQQGEARRNQARGNPDVLKMQIGKEELPTGIKSLSKETTGEIYTSKDAYDKAMLFKTLQEDVPRASYIEGDKLITVYPQNIPKEILRSTGVSPTATIIRDAKTGKVIKD
jgi:hypothetical protein